MSGNQERKRKSDYRPANKNKKHGTTAKSFNFGITQGMRGVLVTCTRGKEGQAVKELYSLFSEYAEKLAGGKGGANDLEGGNSCGKEKLSVEDTIAAELEELSRPTSKNKLKSINTSTECVVFIQLDGTDPVALVHTLLTDIYETQTRQTRFSHRFVPFSETCHASMESIEKTARKILEPHFHDDASTEQKTFKIVPRIRQCDRVSRDDLIKCIADIVGDRHKAEMENPELVIMVETFRNVCGISVVRDYVKLKRYNAAELLGKSTTEAVSTEDAKEASSPIQE